MHSQIPTAWQQQTTKYITVTTTSYILQSDPKRATRVPMRNLGITNRNAKMQQQKTPNHKKSHSYCKTVRKSQNPCRSWSNVNIQPSRIQAKPT
jgi:hypothetical protein